MDRLVRVGAFSPTEPRCLLRSDSDLQTDVRSGIPAKASSSRFSSSGRPEFPVTFPKNFRFRTRQPLIRQTPRADVTTSPQDPATSVSSCLRQDIRRMHLPLARPVSTHQDENHIHADPDKASVRPVRGESAFWGSDTTLSLLRFPVHAASASIDRRQPDAAHRQAYWARTSSFAGLSIASRCSIVRSV